MLDLDAEMKNFIRAANRLDQSEGAHASRAAGTADQKTVELDEFDRRILRLLQRDASLSQREIGDAVCLGPSAINRRILALEDAGIITARVAVLDPSKLGRSLRVIVQVTVKQQDAATLNRVKQQLAAHPAVSQLYTITGDHDFVVFLTAGGMDDYHTIAKELFFLSEDIHRASSMFVMEAVKTGYAVSI